MKPRHGVAALLLAVGGAGLQAACGVPLSERVVEITNRCQDDGECGEFGRCIENTCIATLADLGDLVIEVEVPASSPYAPSTTHVVSPRHDKIELSGAQPNGFYSFYDILLAELVELNVGLRVDNLPAGCGALADSEQRVPIRVELSQTRGAFGLIPPGVATRVYDASTAPAADTNDVAINVPAGAYDLYITPLVPGDPLDPEDPYFGCNLPPRLILDRDITEGTIEDTVDFAAMLPGEQGSVTGTDLDGWTVALIENKNGRLVSDVYPLKLSEVESAFTLHYWPENGEDGVVLRLTPPPDKAATGGMPVFYWLLSNLPTNAVTIESLETVSPIEISGGILDEAYNLGVPATISIRSDSLDIGFGPNVIYRRTVQTDPDGGFSGFSLLPGEYTFVIEPAAGDDLAVTSRPYSLKKGSQGSGQSLTVKRKLPLVGSAATTQGAAAAQITAVLEPSIPESGTYLQNVQRTLPVLPSGASTITSSSGAFSLLVDRGTFNLSLRPEVSSDLPWAVVSRFFIDENQNALDPVSLRIPNPVLLVGEVRSRLPSLPIPNSRIRAWIRPTPLETDGETTGEPTAIQIAETTSNEKGGFRLLLPGSLATISQ